MKRVFTWTWRRIVSTFLAGLFALLPLVITVAIVAWVVNLLDSVVGPESWVGQALTWVGLMIVPEQVGGPSADYYASARQAAATLVGWVLVLAAIFLVGVLVQARAWSLFDAIFNPVIRRIPVINSVYGTASQFVSMLKRDEKEKLTGMSVVFCGLGQPPGAGVLALMPTATISHFGGRPYQVVYVPASPVPMTGWLMYVPAESVTPVSMSVEALMTFYLSMGVTVPPAISSRAAKDAKAMLKRGDVPVPIPPAAGTDDSAADP